MDLVSLGAAIRRSWWLIALVAVICVGAAAAYTTQQQPTYASHTQLFVAAQAPRSDLQDTYQGGLFTTGRVQSYARIASSPIVTTPVIEELGLRTTPTALGKRITAIAPPETVLVDITVKDSTAEGAQRIARSVAGKFATAIQSLERPAPNRKGNPPVRLSVSLPATHPSGRIAPRTTVNLVAGMALGLLLGLAAALLRARVDTRITSAARLPSVPGAVLLGTLPVDPDAVAGPVVSLRNTDPARAEALRRLRTNLRFLDPDDPPRTIVITSATEGEGRTTVAIGLAMALADAGTDVVLIEGDLRAPVFGERLGLLPTEGVAGHLVGSTPVDEQLQGWPAGSSGGRLRVLTAGTVPPNPSELLGSGRMRELLVTLKEHADIVIIDAPALLPVTDAAVLASQCDGVVVVARMGRVTQPQMARALQALGHVHARVLGFVANAAPKADGDERQPAAWDLPPVSLNGHGTGSRTPSGAR